MRLHILTCFQRLDVAGDWLMQGALSIRGNKGAAHFMQQGLDPFQQIGASSNLAFQNPRGASIHSASQEKA